MTTQLSWAMAVLMVAACSASDSPPADEGTDGATPEASPSIEIVGEGVISTSRNQTFPTQDPVSGDLWFSEYESSFGAQTILLSPRVEAAWQEPELAPFSGTWNDRSPRFNPDGSALYFTSNRPRSQGGSSGDMNIWRVVRADGVWGEPQLLEAPVNSEADDIHPSITEAAIWLASRREGGFGASDIYRIDTDGSVAHLPSPLNDEHSQPDLWVAPDESWMILAITDHPSGLGGDDLYVSRRDGDAWTPPMNLGAEINSAEYEYGPSVSPDGEHLYFTSHRTGSANVYRVPMQQIRAILEEGTPRGN